MCTMGDEVNPCVARRGETLQEVEGSKRCILPSRYHCHSLSLASVNPDWFYLPGFYLSGTCSPGWSRTNSRRAVKRLCVCVCVQWWGLGRGLAPLHIKIIKFTIKLYLTSMTPVKTQASHHAFIVGIPYSMSNRNGKVKIQNNSFSIVFIITGM